MEGANVANTLKRELRTAADGTSALRLVGGRRRRRSFGFVEGAVDDFVGAFADAGGVWCRSSAAICLETPDDDFVVAEGPEGDDVAVEVAGVGVDQEREDGHFAVHGGFVFLLAESDEALDRCGRRAAGAVGGERTP